MRVITLVRGEKSLVDDEDFERLSQHRWYAIQGRTTVYAQGAIRQPDGRIKSVGMHRFIMGEPVGMEVDHIDGDGLNNQQSNLRVASTAENQRNRTGINRNNRSGVRGVFWVKREGRWRAQICVDGKNIGLGDFAEFGEAVIARRQGELDHFGEFAPFYEN